MGCAGSKHDKDGKGKKALGKGLMGAAKLAAKAGTNEIGDLVNTEDLGEGGEFLEGAAKFAAKTAVKTAEKQLKDKDEKKSDHDKDTTGNKDNIEAAAKVATKLTSVAIDAATDN